VNCAHAVVGPDGSGYPQHVLARPEVQLDPLEHRGWVVGSALDERSPTGQVHGPRAMRHPVLKGDDRYVGSDAGAPPPLHHTLCVHVYKGNTITPYVGLEASGRTRPLAVQVPRQADSRYIGAPQHRPVEGSAMPQQSSYNKKNKKRRARKMVLWRERQLKKAAEQASKAS
jgi:hypothetical protein